VGENQIVKLFESPIPRGFDTDVYVNRFRSVVEHPEAYISEISLRKHFLLDLGKRLKHREDYFLKRDSIFSIDVDYSKLLTKMVRHRDDVPRTTDLMVSLWDVPRHARHGNAEFLSVAKFTAFVIITNTKSRIRTRILDPDQSNDLLRKEMAERELNDAEIKARVSEGLPPPRRLPAMPLIHRDRQNILLYAANGSNEQVMKIRKSDSLASQGIQLTLEDNLPPLLVHATEPENLGPISAQGFTTSPSGLQGGHRDQIYTRVLSSWMAM